jgi:hypothetical protein
MVFFWLFPERTERLALISSGGLGHEVSPLLRAAALPGVQALLWAAAHPRLLHTARAGAEELKRRGSDKAVYLEQSPGRSGRSSRPGRRSSKGFRVVRAAASPGHG